MNDPKVLPPLDAQDADIVEKSLSATPAEIKLADDLILALNHGTALLSGWKHDRGLDFVIGILVADAFNKLYRARIDAVAGYETPSMTLIRSAFESWLAAKWLREHPEQAPLWAAYFFQEQDETGEHVPPANRMMRDLGEEQIVHDTYDALSKFGHPRGKGLRWLFHGSGDQVSVHYGLHFDEDGLSMCLFFLVTTAQHLLPVIERLQRKVLGNVSPEWLAEAQALTDATVAFMNDHLSQFVESRPEPDSE